MGAASDRYTALAKKLVTKFGRASAVVFTRPSVGDYNPTTLTRVEGTPLTYTCVAAPVDFTLFEKNQVTSVVGSKMLYIPGIDTSSSTVDPQVGDTVDLGTVYRVLEVTAYETESINCGFLLKIGV